MPLSYADELYALRTHIHMVAERLIDPAPAIAVAERERDDAGRASSSSAAASAASRRCARCRRPTVEITLVDRTNHHLFQPLLYQVATAGPERAGGRARRSATCCGGRCSAAT